MGWPKSPQRLLVFTWGFFTLKQRRAEDRSGGRRIAVVVFMMIMTTSTLTNRSSLRFPSLFRVRAFILAALEAPLADGGDGRSPPLFAVDLWTEVEKEKEKK